MVYQSAMNKPTLAYILSLIGGLVGIAFGLLSMWAFVGSTSSGGYQYEWYNDFLYYGLLLLICSAIVIFAARKLNSNPTGHIKWGIIILICSIIMIGPFYRLITMGTPHIIMSILGVGCLLGSIGGVLALLFKPETVPPQQPTAYTQPSPPPPVSPQAYTPPACQTCGAPLTFVTEYNRWYCQNCKKYA